MDGFGINEEKKGNAVDMAKTPNLEHKLYSVPVETDIAVAEMKLAKTSVAIDALSAEQKEYLGY
jgi:S-adenosylhomocysteine hydrolase